MEITNLFFDIFKDDIHKIEELTKEQMNDIKEDILNGNIPYESTFMTTSDFIELVWENNFNDEEMLAKLRKLFCEIHQCEWDERLFEL